jgi:hypothetical protein
MKFFFDINKIALWWLPNKMQNEKHWAWLKTIASPLVWLWIDFLDFRQKTKYESYLTGQTFQLQRALNDAFDNISRRIQIIEYENEYVFFFKDSDNQPTEDHLMQKDTETTIVPPFYMYFGSEGTNLIEDFRVICPNELNPKQNQIIAIIKKYALADKSFAVQFN